MIDFITVEKFRRFLIENRFEKHFYQLESSITFGEIADNDALYAHVVTFSIFCPLNKRPIYEALVIKMSHYLKDEKIDKRIEALETNLSIQPLTLIEDILYESLSILRKRNKTVILLYVRGFYNGISKEEEGLLENSILEVCDEFVIVLIPLQIDTQQLTTLNINNKLFMEKKSFKINKVHFSYKHLDRYQSHIDSICRGLKKAHIEFSIDQIDLQIMDSIKKYEDEIGASVIVIVIISPEYLKSIQCMYELKEIVKNGNIANRIIPIVDIDGIPRTSEGLRYIKDFWNHERIKIWNKIPTEPGKSNYLTRIIGIIDDIIYCLDDIWFYITDNMTGGIEVMSANEGDNLVKCVQKLLNHFNQELNYSNDFVELSSTSIAPVMTAPSTSRQIQQGDKSLYIEHNDGTIVIS